MKILFTKHSKETIEERHLLKEEVVDSIKYPDKITKKNYKYFFIKKLNRGTIETCCQRTESYLKVITIYWYRK